MTGESDFWSRRKAKVAAEEREIKRARDEAEAAAARAELEDREDDEILAELELPDPDTLEAGDDFTRFMAAAVPERLRRRALRRLWRSNPTLANLDSLVDYGEDFTGSGVAGAVVETAYQVGRGMTRHAQALMQKAETAETAEVAAPDREEPEFGEESAPAAHSTLASEPELSDTAPTARSSQEDDVDTIASAPRRRMRFEFNT